MAEVGVPSGKTASGGDGRQGRVGGAAARASMGADHPLSADLTTAPKWSGRRGSPRGQAGPRSGDRGKPVRAAWPSAAKTVDRLRAQWTPCQRVEMDMQVPKRVYRAGAWRTPPRRRPQRKKSCCVPHTSMSAIMAVTHRQLICGCRLPCYTRSPTRASVPVWCAAWRGWVCEGQGAEGAGRRLPPAAWGAGYCRRAGVCTCVTCAKEWQAFLSQHPPGVGVKLIKFKGFFLSHGVSTRHP